MHLNKKCCLNFKPGITGLWQISGRSNIINFDDIVKLDVTYLDVWTIWKDIEIFIEDNKSCSNERWSEVKVFSLIIIFGVQIK